MEPFEIRGQWVTPIPSEIAYFRTLNWQFKKFKPQPALIDSSDNISLFQGQQYDANAFTLDPEGWNHDHCEICGHTLCDSDEPEELYGYFSDQKNWLCHECYHKLVTEDYSTNDFVVREKFRIQDDSWIVLISPMTDSHNFEITETSTFGNYPIQKYLVIPRRVRFDGNPDLKSFAIKTVHAADFDKIQVDHLYKLGNLAVLD